MSDPGTPIQEPAQEPDAVLRFRCVLCGREETSPVYLPGNPATGLDIARTPDCAYRYVIGEPLRRIGWSDEYVGRDDSRGAIVCNRCKPIVAAAEKARKAYREALDPMRQAFAAVRCFDACEIAESTLNRAWTASRESRTCETLRAMPEDSGTIEIGLRVKCSKDGCGHSRIVTFEVPDPVTFIGGYDLMVPNGDMDQGWYLSREMGFAGYMWCPDHAKEGRYCRVPSRDRGPPSRAPPSSSSPSRAPMPRPSPSSTRP